MFPWVRLVVVVTVALPPEEPVIELAVELVVWAISWIIVPVSERYANGTSSLGAVKNKLFPCMVP